MMLHAIDDLTSNQFVNDLQHFAQAAVGFSFPSLIGAAPEVASAARMQIDAINRAADKLEDSFQSVHVLTQAVISGSTELTPQQARDNMELFASVDTMVFGQAGVIRYQLRHQIEFDPNLGEFREPLVAAYERAIGVLERVHRNFLLLMNHTRQFLSPQMVCDAKFNPSRDEIDSLATASVAMLESIKAGDPIEFV